MICNKLKECSLEEIRNIVEGETRFDEIKYDMFAIATVLGRADVVEYLVADGVDVKKPLKRMANESQVLLFLR